MSRLLSVVCLISVIAGCHLRPEFGPPGTIGVQRSRAVLNDPFPSDELGPEILGVRPRGFDLPEPRAEGLQKYSPRPNFVPPNNPFPIAAQPIIPNRPIATQAVPTQIVPTQTFPIQPTPTRPGFANSYSGGFIQ